MNTSKEQNVSKGRIRAQKPIVKMTNKIKISHPKNKEKNNSLISLTRGPKSQIQFYTSQNEESGENKKKLITNKVTNSL